MNALSRNTPNQMIYGLDGRPVIVRANTAADMAAQMIERRQKELELRNWREMVKFRLRDQFVLTGGQTLRKGEYQLFNVPQGSPRTAWTADRTPITTTEEHTNLRTVRRLPDGRAFSAHAMYVDMPVQGNPDTVDNEFDSAQAADSTPLPNTGISAVGLLADLRRTMEFTLKIGDNELESEMLSGLTAPTGIASFGQPSNDVVANNGFGRPYELVIPRDIYGNEDFEVRVRVFRDVKITRTVVGDFILDGWLMRPVGR